MATLTSPGVSVFVNDQSIVSEPAPTTIPLVVIATRSNKLTPDGTGVALGTAEANKLRLFTSARELREAYGNPVFVTSAGEPVHGQETNEYGLAAVDAFLNLSNRAFVLRADVDLGQLLPQRNEPVLPPADGTYWMKSDTVVGGIFRYNGSAWDAVPFRVYTIAPTGADGTNGDWCFDYSTSNGTMKYKEGGNWRVATTANLQADFGGTVDFFVQGVSPVSPSTGDIWYKTTASGGGSNLRITRFRAIDGVWVTSAILRQTSMPLPNQNTLWEDLSALTTTGARPIYIGTGAQWIPLPLIVQQNAPIAEPAIGTLWYDDTISDFALYVEGTDLGRGNEWVPITTTTVSNPTASQKVISGSAPQFPNEGAIWVDISTPEALDNFPVIKRWQSTQWVDISDSVTIRDTDPDATAVLNGTYWLNTSEYLTRNTVKRYDPSYTAVKVVLQGPVYTVVTEEGNHWAPYAGTQFGRRAVRDFVVEKLQAALNSNDDIRAEDIYFQLIAVPGYPELYDEMVRLNADNEEVSFGIADTPKYMTPSGISVGREVTVREWITNANNVSATGEQGFAATPSPYMGFWYPWGLSSNVDGEDVFVPPSHAILRTMAYNDTVAAPWFPPAGYTRGRVDVFTSVGYLNNEDEYTPLRLRRSQRDIMYENRINPIAFMPNRGLVVFGQKTMSPVASAMDRVNVVRLIAKMKYDLRRLLEPFLFEINDPITRRSAQLVTERYLGALKSLRALYDSAVRCNEENNTPERIDRNELWVDVAIKPAKAIEFIYVPITVAATGDSLTFFS